MTDDCRKALQGELDALNAEWNAITAKRKAWMDAHMADFATYPIGTPLYLKEGKPGRLGGHYFGEVIEYYRYPHNNPEFDRSMDIYYRVRTPSGFIDNTSRLSGGNYAVESAPERAERLTREAEDAKDRERMIAAGVNPRDFKQVIAWTFRNSRATMSANTITTVSPPRDDADSP